MLIAWLPAASPERLFPTNLVKPLIDNLKVMMRSRPLALAMLGIAFFVFMVSYMRASMYMHGETRNPRWDEQHTSLIVATVALGVGLGSPLAGYLSGGKVELGLVPLGCLGMIFALVVSALAIDIDWILVGALIVIGFFSGFYMVPLYTLLQHSAPKKSKGEMVATSNFVNVTGAIAASVLFKVLVLMGQTTGLTPAVHVTDKVFEGTLDEKPEIDKRGKIKSVVILGMLEGALEQIEDEETERKVIDTSDSLFDVFSGTLQKGDEVIIAKYQLRGRKHFVIRRAEQPLPRIYDNERLPSYLFLGAALMTVGILFLLLRKLPDFFVRMLFWMRSLFRYRIRAIGMQNLPTEGPVILATNCKDMIGCLELISATDRSTKVILIDDGGAPQGGPLLRLLARRTSLIVVRLEQQRPGGLGASQDRSAADAARRPSVGHQPRPRRTDRGDRGPRASIAPGDERAALAGLLWSAGG